MREIPFGGIFVYPAQILNLNLGGRSIFRLIRNRLQDGYCLPDFRTRM